MCPDTLIWTCTVHDKINTVQASTCMGHNSACTGQLETGRGLPWPGFAFVDPASGRLTRQQYTKDVVAAACSPWTPPGKVFAV